MKRTYWLILAILALFISGCSTDNSAAGSGTEAVKPPPQVRVELMPSATAAPIQPEASATATLEAPATPAQVYYDPTPDEDAIVNQIDSIIDDINRKLNQQDFLLKP